MPSHPQQKKKNKDKDAPNLRRFRTSILDMVNKKYGIEDTAESESSEKNADEKEGSTERKIPRKIRRKNERMLKKARKLAFSQHRKLPNSLEELKQESAMVTSKEPEKRLSGAQRRKKSKAKKKKLEELDQKTEKEKESKARIELLRTQNAQDDKIIKQLSKQMKLNKRKRKNLPAAFGVDGLDYLLDVIDSEKLAALYNENVLSDDDGGDEKRKVTSSLEKDSDTDSDADMMEQDGDDDSDSGEEIRELEEDQPNTDSAESMNEDEKADNDFDSSNIVDSENSEDGSDDDDDDDDDDVHHRDDEKKAIVREDIYGRTVDQFGKVVTNQTGSSAYIPPAKRAAMLMMSLEKDKAVLDKLDKRVKGLLNRLSEANLAGISSEMEGLYRSNSRALMNQTLLTNTKQSALSVSSMPDRLLMVQAMLIAVLHANVDNEIGAFILQSYAVEMDSLLRSPDLGQTQKQLDNLITFICYLYHFKVVSAVLVMDILKRLRDVFEEKHIELVILVLKLVGFNLRKDDASGLKEMILRVQEKANTADLSTFTDQSRVRFMLDILLAIKNNNTRKLPQYDPEAALQARKAVTQVVRSSGDAGQLRISLNDLLTSESRGAWWRIGSAWSGPTQDAVVEGSDKPLEQVEGSLSADLLDLARKQRMNTEIRRKVFCTIMGSNDFMDCSEKLLRLGLNHRQEQEIVHVLIDCCLNEKTYNPYYGHLAEKLCKTHRRFTITCQFSVWDRLKTLSDLKRGPINNLAEFLSHLIVQGALCMSLFKVLDLGTLNKESLILFRKVFLKLLSGSDAKLNDIFSRVSQSTKYGQLAMSLSAFLQHFILKNYDKLKLDCSREVLERKIGVVDRVLAGENKF